MVQAGGLFSHGRYRNRRSQAGLLTVGAVLALAACSGPSPQTSKQSLADSVKAEEPAADLSLRRLRLVTAEQYINSLAYIFGNEVRMDTHFAPMRRTDGLLQNGAVTAGVTGSQIEQYQRTAGAVAARVVNPEYRSFVMPCVPKDAAVEDEACAAQFLSATGRLLYRRPIDAAVLKAAVGAASDGAVRLKDFYAGIAVAVENMLIAPEVLFVDERIEADPARPGHTRLDAYSLASRLSYLLWNAAPDERLLKAAGSGTLQTAKGRAAEVDRMLASPRFAVGMRAFFDDMFGFDDFDNLAKDPKVYPAFTGVTVREAREQTLRTVIDQLVAKQRDYRDLFTTRETFISPALAAIYQVPITSGTWVPYTFPADSPRTGLLTQISFLAVHSHPGRSSPTVRGKALRELLLCQPVPRPPANVDFSIVEDPKSNFRTARERLTAHRANPVCAGCHKITDPMGLALENFDGAGQYREVERGVPIDTSGSLDGKDFHDVAGLGQALHDHPALPGCLVKRVYSYAVGGANRPEDKAVLDYLNGRFAESGYRLPALLRTIALSKAFSSVAEPPADAGLKSSAIAGTTN